jgi:hypothetical protein
MSAAGEAHDPRRRRLPTDRWRAIEIVFWLIPSSQFFCSDASAVLGSQILITALFATVARPVPGYAGLSRSVMPPFFGFGAYVAGRLAVKGWGEPFSGLLVAASPVRCSVLRRASSSCAAPISRADGDARHRPHAVRSRQPGVLDYRRRRRLVRREDVEPPRSLQVRPGGHDGLRLQPGRAVPVVRLLAATGELAVRTFAPRCAREREAHARDRRTVQKPTDRDLTQ